MYSDSTGTSAVLIIGAVLIGGLITGLFSAAAETNPQNYLGAFVGGFINGSISTLGLAAALATGGLAGLGIAMGSGFIGGFFGDMTGQYISYNDIDYKKSIATGIMSGAMNALAFYGVGLADLNPVGTWGEKFVEAIAPTIVSIGMTAFLNSITPSNLFEREGNTQASMRRRVSISLNLGLII